VFVKIIFKKKRLPLLLRQPLKIATNPVRGCSKSIRAMSCFMPFAELIIRYKIQVFEKNSFLSDLNEIKDNSSLFGDVFIIFLSFLTSILHFSYVKCNSEYGKIHSYHFFSCMLESFIVFIVFHLSKYRFRFY